MLLRRMKEDVETLPDKEEIIIWVELSNFQRPYYKVRTTAACCISTTAYRMVQLGWVREVGPRELEAGANSRVQRVNLCTCIQTATKRLASCASPTELAACAGAVREPDRHAAQRQQE